MRFLIFGALIPPAYYLITYARYTWKDSKSSSCGSIILAVLSIVLPAMLLFLRG